MNSREAAIKVKFDILEELESEINELEKREEVLRLQYYNVGATLHDIDLEIRDYLKEKAKIESMTPDDIMTEYTKDDD